MKHIIKLRKSALQEEMQQRFNQYRETATPPKQTSFGITNDPRSSIFALIDVVYRMLTVKITMTTAVLSIS